FLTTNATYSIYTSNLVSGNEGCALYVGGLDAAAAVNVKVVTIGDDIITLSVQKGSLLPCLVKKVFATGTTASLDLIALWQ
ncbi:MAG: spike base protein, RCAP_Rcc01079 family, partial [Methylophagaceae bacterium]